MARMHSLFGLAALGFMLTGCVTSTDKYTAVKLENESLRSQLGDAQRSAQTAAAERDLLKNQMASMANGTDGQLALLENKNQQIQNLSNQLADINARYKDALERPAVAGGPLDKAVSNALDGFARENPDLVDFDAARGIVKFKTDFTFATGSDALTDRAKSAITRFAAILNSDAAKSYELMVAGHTDDTPVVNPATKAKHPDNWYLSSHRAIAVGEELTKAHVSTQRVAVVGYADQRPIAPNTSANGKAQNRRVEVLILPSTVRATTVVRSTPTARTGTAATPKKLGNQNKDSTVAPLDTRPILNK